jgi:hypothetical protein
MIYYVGTYRAEVIVPRCWSSYWLVFAILWLILGQLIFIYTWILPASSGVDEDSVGSHGSLSLLMMKVMILDFVSNSHKFMVRLIIILHASAAVEFFMQSCKCVFQWLQWMIHIQVSTSNVLKEYVQGGGGTDQDPLFDLSMP